MPVKTTVTDKGIVAEQAVSASFSITDNVINKIVTEATVRNALSGSTESIDVNGQQIRNAIIVDVINDTVTGTLEAMEGRVEIGAKSSRSVHIVVNKTAKAKVSASAFVVFAAHFAMQRTAYGAGDDTIAILASIIAKTAITSGGDTMTLPDASNVTTGCIFVIKDESGNAGTDNISINVSGGGTIDGALTKTINTNF